VLTKLQHPKLSVVKPRCTPAQLCPRCSLLLVIRYRFNAFRELFGREPKPTEPLFFDHSKSRLAKASVGDARVQIETAAVAVGVEAERVLRFIGFDSPEKTDLMAQNPVQPTIHGASSGAWANPPRPKADSPWERFAKNDRLHRLHNITPQELKTLAGIAMMGEIRTSRDLLYILGLIREHLEQR